MKLVREHINEKFTDDDSDPIHDMGIGIFIKRNFDNFESATDFIIKYLPAILNLEKIPEDIINDRTYFINYKYQELLNDYLYTYISINNMPIIIKSNNGMIGNVHQIMYKIFKEKGYKTAV
jgi:hypothetical protein